MITILFLAAALAVPVWGQEAASQAQEEKPVSSSPYPSDWTVEVYQPSHQSMSDLMSLLHNIVRPYHFSISETYNSMTLRAPRDVHQTVDALIRRFDQPTKSVRVRFYLLRGLRRPNGTPDDLPSELQPVLEDLSDVTQFQSFQLIAAPSGRTRSGESLHLEGGDITSHSIFIERIEVSGQGEIGMDDLRVQVRDQGPTRGPESSGSASLSLSVDLGDGETVVLGSSQLSRRVPDAEGRWMDESVALIVIVRADILE
ncbi:MAG TPA: hypothetical protein VLU25_15060 [Acidobacteriota bacterium]|nr:hypothetical protein [Acidobacteriota bacterium]